MTPTRRALFACSAHGCAARLHHPYPPAPPGWESVWVSYVDPDEGIVPYTYSTRWTCPRHAPHGDPHTLPSGLAATSPVELSAPPSEQVQDPERQEFTLF